MANIRNSILATLTYYGLFEMPLTLVEVHKYFVNPGRLAKLAEDVGRISLNDIVEELEHLVKIGLAYEHNGFYALNSECSRWYERRIEREKISAQKWKKLLWIGYWFQAVPYVRAIMVSGSLAVSNAGPKSDFDVLVVMKSGRLYTGRILLSAMASLFGARRTKDDKIAPDKFCFNHYVTDTHLHIDYQSLYNAQTYVNLRPIFFRDDMVERFYQQNSWLNKFILNFYPDQQTILRSVKSSWLLNAIAWIGELLLDTGAGEWIEIKLKAYQQGRIRNNPVTYEPGGRTIFTDSQLEFHPHSAEASLITRYNKNLRSLGVIQYEEEKDSGLTSSIN
jgi:hypothetical protein